MTASEPDQPGWTVVAWDATMPAAGALTVQMKDRDGSEQLMSMTINRAAAGEKFRVVFRHRVVGAKIEARWALRRSDKESTGECYVELRGEGRSSISHNAIPMLSGEVFVPGKWIPLYAVAWVDDSRKYGFSKWPLGPDGPRLELRRDGKEVDRKTYDRPWLALHLHFEAS